MYQGLSDKFNSTSKHALLDELGILNNPVTWTSINGVCRLGWDKWITHYLLLLPLFVLSPALPKRAVDSKQSQFGLADPAADGCHEPGSPGHELYLGYCCLLD